MTTTTPIVSPPGRPTVIRTRAAHEFLALVPELAGARPRRSLVCVAFRGSRTVGLLRHALPLRLADHPAVVQAALATLCRIDGVDAVVPVVYTDRAYPRGAGAAERKLLGRLVDRLEDAGFVVRDSLLVAATGWASQFDRAAPVTGHPLALIDEAAARLADLVPERDALECWDAPAELQAEVAQLLAGPGRRVGRGEPAGAEGELEGERDAELGEPDDPIELVETLLAAERPPQASGIARLVHLASLAAYRDAIVLQIGFGATVGELALEGSLAANDRAARAQLPLDDLVRAEFAAGAADEVDELVGRMFLGETKLRPDASRVRRGIRLVEFAIALCPPAERPGLHCIAAWLHWSLGVASRAGKHLDLALEIDRRHPMAGLLAGYFGSGMLPEWAFAAPPNGSVLSAP